MKVRPILIAVLMSIIAVTPFLTAQAYTESVTLKYIIPQVTTFSVQFPTGLGLIQFEPSGATFSNLPASSQDATTSAMNITNTGNVDIKIDASLTADLPTGVTEFRINTANDYNGGWWWTDANETSAQTIINSLAMGDSVDFWAWSTGANVPAGTYTSTQLQLVSSAV